MNTQAMITSLRQQYNEILEDRQLIEARYDGDPMVPYLMRFEVRLTDALCYLRDRAKRVKAA